MSDYQDQLTEARRGAHWSALERLKQGERGTQRPGWRKLADENTKLIAPIAPSALHARAPGATKPSVIPANRAGG